MTQRRPEAPEPSETPPRPPPGARHDRWPFALALGLSLLLHLGLLLLPMPTQQRQAPPIEVEFVYVDGGEAGSAHEMAQAASDVPAPAEEARSTSDVPPPAAAASQPARADAQVVTGEDAAGAAAAQAPPQGQVPEDAATPPSAAPDRRTVRRLELLPDAVDLAAAAPGAPAPPAHAGPPPGADHPGPGERLGALLADDRAVERATERVHAHWGELRRHLARTWAVEKEVFDGPSRGLGLGLDEAWDGWRSQAAAYAQSGNPFGDEPLAPGSLRLQDRALPVEKPRVPLPGEAVGLDGSDEGMYRKRRMALVLVDHDEAGQVIGVRLHRSSGNAAFDRRAIEQAHELGKLDPVPPPDGRRSLWAFGATLLTTPPAPVAGCAIDAHFIPSNCFYPLKQRVKTDVHLVGVWQADEEPGLR